MPNILDNILAEVCLDERIPDGIFDMSNNSHMEALLENLTNEQQIPVNDAKAIHNKMVEGKYPERQAYNKDGLLVTFPTPQHKQRAIQRGTHFEQDPSAKASNVFAGGQPPAGQAPAGQPPATPPAASKEPATPPAPETPATPPASAPASGGASSLPASETPPPAPAPAAGGQSAPSSLPASDQPTPAANAAASDKQQLAVEPPATPAAPAAPAPPPNFDTPKTPQQRAAESQVVKQMMRGDGDPDQTLPPPPSLPEQMERVEGFCKQENLQEMLNVIRSMRAMGTILEDMARNKRK